MGDRIYLDYNATTPLDPAVRAAMEPWLGPAANPSSIHAEGRLARGAVDTARDEIAALLGVKPGELVFTGGGTESIHLGIRGLALAQKNLGKRHVITSAVEHHAVLGACELLERDGFEVTMLPVDAAGRVDPAALAAAIRPETALVTIMSANNETGVRQPIPEILALCAGRGVLFHTDAVQSAGKEPLPARQADGLSLAAHKFYGPIGAGLLVVRAGVPFQGLLRGGAQETSRRPGTENVAAIVGLAAALALAENMREAEAARQAPLVEKLWLGLADLPGIHLNSDRRWRLPNTLNVSFTGADGEDLLIGLDLAGLAVSSGSACLVGSIQPSHVLAAMGVPIETARATIRFSIGRGTREAEIEETIGRVRDVISRQRAAALAA